MLKGEVLEELAGLVGDYSTVSKEERGLAEEKKRLRDRIVSIMHASEATDVSVAGYHVFIAEREDVRIPVATAVEKLPYDLLKSVLQTKMVEVLNVKKE